MDVILPYLPLVIAYHPIRRVYILTSHVFEIMWPLSGHLIGWDGWWAYLIFNELHLGKEEDRNGAVLKVYRSQLLLNMRVRKNTRSKYECPREILYLSINCSYFYEISASKTARWDSIHRPPCQNTICHFENFQSRSQIFLQFRIICMADNNRNFTCP